MHNPEASPQTQREQAEPSLQIPTDFMLVADPRIAGMDRKLGYYGRARFVIFYYEARGEDVMWKDGTSCGFGSGAWRIFFDEIGPLATHFKADIGSSELAGAHALLIDREKRVGYFARRQSADEFMAAVHGFPPKHTSCLTARPANRS